MGCLGHVVIVEDPDYEKWGIEIQVSFRDNEPLVRLDPHRQSGGVSYFFHTLLIHLNKPHAIFLRKLLHIASFVFLCIGTLFIDNYVFDVFN